MMRRATLWLLRGLRDLLGDATMAVAHRVHELEERR